MDLAHTLLAQQMAANDARNAALHAERAAARTAAADERRAARAHRRLHRSSVGAGLRDRLHLGHAHGAH
ncbi:hypothetical protein [Agromyces sp. GXS1127]|uniref:hypothetical protein n=1 Tax=Agromyces sp. GXS1127 TaxID=3424181 RepID=UPI003D31F0F4